MKKNLKVLGQQKLYTINDLFKKNNNEKSETKEPV